MRLPLNIKYYEMLSIYQYLKVQSQWGCKNALKCLDSLKVVYILIADLLNQMSQKVHHFRGTGIDVRIIGMVSSHVVFLATHE